MYRAIYRSQEHAGGKGEYAGFEFAAEGEAEVRENLKYAGGETFILYGIARAEQHFYVDADSQGLISRFYWIQFEEYLPGSTHKYNYSFSEKKVTIDGLDFFADAWRRKLDMSTTSLTGARGYDTQVHV